MGSFLSSHQAWAFFPRVTLGSPRKEGTGEVAGHRRQRSPPPNRRESWSGSGLDPRGGWRSRHRKQAPALSTFQAL